VGVTPHDRILDTAARLFVEEGVLAVGMNRIAAEADVAPMTIYRQFGSKERLVAAVVEDWSARSLRWLAERLDPRGQGSAGSLQELWGVLEQWLAADELHAALLTRVAIELRGQGDHPAGKAVEAHRVAMRQLLEDLATRMGALDPTGVAGQLLFLVEAAALVEAWPAGAGDVRALADAALKAAPTR
jgi:AcrR family transcriptional regulator